MVSGEHDGSPALQNSILNGDFFFLSRVFSSLKTTRAYFL